jgi:hypothetical protein
VVRIARPVEVGRFSGSNRQGARGLTNWSGAAPDNDNNMAYEYWDDGNLPGLPRPSRPSGHCQGCCEGRRRNRPTWRHRRSLFRVRFVGPPRTAVTKRPTPFTCLTAVIPSASGHPEVAVGRLHSITGQLKAAFEWMKVMRCAGARHAAF